MPRRCNWCDKWPLLEVETARVGAETEVLICRECWPDEWGEFPHDKRREAMQRE